MKDLIKLIFISYSLNVKCENLLYHEEKTTNKNEVINFCLKQPTYDSEAGFSTIFHVTKNQINKLVEEKNLNYIQIVDLLNIACLARDYLKINKDGSADINHVLSIYNLTILRNFNYDLTYVNSILNNPENYKKFIMEVFQESVYLKMLEIDEDIEELEDFNHQYSNDTSKSEEMEKNNILYYSIIILSLLLIFMIVAKYPLHKSRDQFLYI